MKKDTESHSGPVHSGLSLYYSESVMDHFINPRNVGELQDADGQAEVGDITCGDHMTLAIRVEDGFIAQAVFRCFGCPGAIATSSMTTVLATGMCVEDAKCLTDDDIVQALGGLPEYKRHCSLMGVRALQRAIKDFENKARAC